MEGMTAKTEDSRFQKVLQAEQLADLSQFCQGRLCDEVPLYSRYDQVSFLSGEWKEVSSTLLTLGLNFLEDIINKLASSKSPSFAALTVWEDECEEPIVPNVFVCNNDPTQQLKKLKLHEPRAPFSKKINQLVSQISLADRYLVLEDDETLEDQVRVFIGHKVSHFPGFIPLGSLLADVAPSPARERKNPSQDSGNAEKKFLKGWKRDNQPH
jgi:hypothetical protein